MTGHARGLGYEDRIRFSFLETAPRVVAVALLVLFGASSSASIGMPLLAFWLGASLATQLALDVFSARVSDPRRRTLRVVDVLLLVGFLTLAWPWSNLSPQASVATSVGPPSGAGVVPASVSAASMPSVALAASSVPAPAASSPANVCAGCPTTPKPDDGINSVASLATILGAVLAVVTLVATKTATDAQAAVRLEVEKLDAVARAGQQARLAEGAMLTAIFQNESIRLGELMQMGDAALAAGAAKHQAMLAPLSRLMHGLSQPLAAVASVRSRAAATRLLSLLTNTPWTGLDAEVLPDESRELLRQTGQVIEQRLTDLRAKLGAPTPAELALFDDLAFIAVHLQRA